MAAKKITAKPLSSFDDLDAAGIGVGYQPMSFADEPAVVAAPEKQTFARRIGDTAVQFGQGAVTGVKMMSDIFGANNAVSSGLSDVNQALDGLLSATAQGDKQKVAQIMQEAEGKGWGEQIVAGLKAAGVDPVGLAANALGTSLPTMATMLIPGAGPAAVAARMGAGVAMGAGQGVGAVKGQIYDETKRKWLEARATPEQAEARAQEASAYGGGNTDQIAIGGVLGMGSVLGAERALGKVLHGASKAGPGMLGRVATSTLAETGTEMLQGGQEKFATNTALNRQGFDVDPMSGVIANATLEGAAAAPMGAVAGIPKPAVATAPGIDPAKEAADTIRATETVPESGPMTRASNAATEAKAQAIEAGAPLLDEQAAAEPVPEPVDDPVRDQILALPDGARQDALRAYAVLNRPDAAKGVLQLNRKLLDRLLAENQPKPVLGDRLTDTDMGTMLGGGGMMGNADPLMGALGMNREAQANSITNVARAAQNRPPMPASDAARMLDEARNQGVDLVAAEHPAGGFVLVPPQWVTPDMAAQGEQRLNETIARMQQADAAPVDRAQRTSTAPVDLSLPTDPVQNYVGNLRQVNTPAAQAFVRDFDAGRITPADVQQRMQAEKGLTPDQRLQRAASEAPAQADPVAERLRQAVSQSATSAPTDILNPSGLPFKTMMSARLAAKRAPGAEVVPVEGGFVVRPQEPVNVQDVPQAPEVPQAAPAISQPGQAAQAVGTQPAGPAAGVPTEGAGAVEAAGLTENKVGRKDSAQIAQPESVVSDAAQPWANMTPEQRRRSRLEREIATGMTNNGGVMAKLRPSAIEKRKQELAAMPAVEAAGGEATSSAAVIPSLFSDPRTGAPVVVPNKATADAMARSKQLSGKVAVRKATPAEMADDRNAFTGYNAGEARRMGYVLEMLQPQVSQPNKPQTKAQQAQAATENVATTNPQEGAAKKTQEARIEELAQALKNTPEYLPLQGVSVEQAKTDTFGISGSGWYVMRDGQKISPQFPTKAKAEGFMSVMTGDRNPEHEQLMRELTGAANQLAQPPASTQQAQAATESVAPDAEQSPAQETTHNGTRIYPTKIKVGDEVKSMWAVESPDNQRRRAAGERTIGGDSLHDTIEQAKVAAEREVKRDAEQRAAKAEQDAADKARLDAEEARKAANRPKTVVERRKDAILDGPSKIGQGTKRAVIATAVDNGYAIEAKMVYDHAAKKRDQEAVDRASRAGYILGVSNENLPLVKAGNEAKARLKEGKYEKPEYRVYQGSDTKAPFREITKTEYDYAQELKAQRAAAPQAEIPPASATHTDPGQAPEAATPAVVTDSLKKAARNEDTKPSEMRKWLVGKIDEAIAVAPEAAVDFLSFDVPGDGTFKVQNSQARLQEFRKKVMASPGFKDGGQRQNTQPPEQTDSALNGSGSTVEAIRNFLADGDVQGAVEFAKLKGVEFTPVPPQMKMSADGKGKVKHMPASVKSSMPSVAEGLTHVEAEQINQYLTAEQAMAEPAAAAPEQPKQAHKATETVAEQPDAPKLTTAEAKSLMAWEDLGQKDGVKTHALTFYESQADKDAKRGRMIVAKVSKGDRSATAWMVDGEDKTFGMLAQAKKLAEEVGMAKAVADGFVEQMAPAAATDRNAFTLQRLNRDTGQMESVTFERGEYVRHRIAGKDHFGEIDGISHARREFSVDGLWYAFGFANKAERPTAPKADTVPLSSVIDKMNAKNGQGLTDADRVPEQKPASKTPTVDRHNATMAAVREGKATAEQFRASFEQVVDGKAAIVAELDTMTKVQLLREGGPFVQMRYANEKKADVVDAVYREMVGEYALGESVTYGMGRDSYQNAVRKLVEATDADKLAQYVKDRQDEIAEAQARGKARAAALENPKTLSDFREVLNAKIREGMTRKEAFLTLTPQQRIQYDTLEAESTREARENRKRAQKTEVRAAGHTTAGEIVATKHTRDGYDLFVVKLADRLSKEDYSTVLASAKKLGGWYSAFRGNGAIPGFQFKDKANADAFLALAGGDTAAAQEQVAQRRDAFEDDRSQTAVERLRAMADKLEEGAAEVEGQERKTNTARRARFASAAMASAAADKAKAKTMRNIAQAIEDGDAKFLDAVRTKSQVDMLTGIVDTAKGNELRAKYPSYADQEKRKGEPPTAETADFAEFPSYSAFRSDLATLGRQMLEVDGTKKLGQRLMSVADDVTDAYLEFAKANFQDVSRFGRGDSLADFASKDEAERAIKRSGLTGKAIVLPIKRGQNRVILSPSEAIGRGLWQGDGDKRITLTAEFGAELVEAIGRRGNKQNKLSAPWQFQNAYDRRKALSRIGIETPSEFRAALREFISLKEQAIANRARELELQMVGRKADGLDFFPTSAEVADQMIEAADLTPDMAVLEPSAGMGHLADRIREAGAEPDVIEISADRRALLEEKGYTTQAVDDFLDLKPREFYTFGDTFRAPDGAEGIMRGANGNRVKLVNQAGDMVGAGYYDRADLTGVAHNGTASGYDRIIMNPPFSNRRDAEHVRHAYSLLKPGGRIVAIMGEGVFFGQDKKAQDFREWLESVGGTSEKLPDGSFMDPSLPVNTSVNARMVVIDKAKGVALFATASAPVAPGQGITLQAAQQATDKVLDGLGMRGVVVPKVFRNTAAAGISDPGSVMPTGGTSNGEVYLFTDNIHDEADAFKVVFHELFHLGLSQSVKPQEYIQTMLQFLRDPLVRKYANEWKQSKDGRSRLGTLPLNNWHALAVEEALAVIGENLNTDGKGIGTKEMQGWVRRTIAWLADLAQSWKMPAVARKLRGMTYTQAEAFVQETMLKGRTGAPVLLPDTRFRSAADTAQAVGDTLKSITVSNIKQRAGFKFKDYLGLGLQALGRRQIVDIYGDMLPLAEYNRLVTQMEADKNEGGAEADKLVTRWAKLDDEAKLADLMHDATLAQIDPDKPYADGDDKGKFLMLERKFKLLSDEAKAVYRDTRDAYKAHHAKVRSAIKERIERSELKGARKAELLQQMDSEFFAAVKGVYFPLARFGQYVVTVKGPDGKVESVSRAETMAEADALRTNLLSAFPRDKGFTVGRVMLSKEFVASRDAVGRGFMTELYQVLDKQDMDAAQRAELEDTLGQLYLSSLPDLSWAKHGIHRKGTPGFSQDARRAYAQNMFHGARYLAKLRYSDLMQDELTAMQKHVDDWREVEDFDQTSAQRVVDEMNKRHESLMNPKSNKLSTWATSLGFVFHLGLSPASAMVNLSQTALVAYPIMGAKWGFGKASAALLKASAEAAKGKNDITASLNEDELAAYNEAVRAGTIDVTMAHDLAGIAQGEDAGVMWKIRPVMRYASILFHHAERFNRQVTFVAAYRLAREAGADQKSAFEQATKATYDGHFDYGAANRPRVMQGNVAKVLLLFKQYGQNMVYTLARNAQQAIKGESPEVRAQARKALSGLLATHAMAAGVLGLPMVTTLLAAASMIGGDDDEPWDAKVALQNMLADTFGQKPAEVLAHGLSRLTPWDISGKVGLDRLIFPDVQEGLEGQRLWESAATQALGPVGGIFGGALKGLDLMSDGHYLLGLEAMLPAVLRQGVKSIRYATEGAQDKTGVVIKDEVSMPAVVGQLLGFSPSEVRLAQEGKSAIYQQDKALAGRRQELLTKAARATMAKDAEARAEAMKEIQRFNQKNPTRRITPLNVAQSVRNSQRRIDQAEGGIYLPKNRRDAMEAGRFALGE